MTRRIVSLLFAVASPIAPAHARVKGEAKLGVQKCRTCVARQSLEAGNRITGPSLARQWGSEAGGAENIIRYPQGLNSADFVRGGTTFNTWLSDPQAMIPDPYMIYREIVDDQACADLVGFLMTAMTLGGTKTVADCGIASAKYVSGQQPESLNSATPRAQVTKIGHCRDSYFVTAADGTELPYWERNVRRKLDTSETGPHMRKPDFVRSGMMDDRVSFMFPRFEAWEQLVVRECY